MFSASLYIIVCSFRNRVRVRLQRLRQPRYFIGAIAGAAYLYFSFFARFRASRSSVARRGNRPARVPASLASALSVAPALGGLALMMAAAGAWLFPVDSSLLEFSEAEQQFLFPAPVSRRQLLIYRIMRSQIGMLFGSAMIGVFSPPTLGVSRLRISAASWIILVTARIYFTGVTLARVRLGASGARTRRVAWLPVSALSLALALVAGAVGAQWRQTPPADALAGLILIGRAADSPAARLVLLPFKALVEPLFSEWPGPYLVAIAWALVVLGAVATWVLLSDEAFQEAVSDAAERRSREPVKRGEPIYKVRSTGWTLPPAGRPETAFAWKAAMQTLRMVDKRSLLRGVVILVSLTIVAALMGQANGLASLLGAFSIAGTLFAILLAPQIVRMDMRQDLQHLELLKTWPVKASAVVRGEMVWPSVIITASAWTMLAVATFLAGTMMSHVDLGLRLGGGAALAILTPALVLSQLTIHNAAALIFPAWVPLGNQRPRGLDAMGQRLIMLGATWLLLALSLLPGAIVGAIVWFAFQHFIGAAALVPAALVCTAIVAIEVLLATEALGPAYERLDVLAVERAE
jgi:putative ABC exporter